MPATSSAIRPVGACLVAMLLFVVSSVMPSRHTGAGRRPAGKSPIAAAYFFGLSRYSCPINYLNAFSRADVDHDLAQISADGFNAVVLLVPWGEIQPRLNTPAVYNEAALARLELLVASARAHDLQVILRLPYLWSTHPEQDMPNVERMTALLFDDRTRAAFLDAVRTIDRRVIRPNSNVRFAFASWEDFYGVTNRPAASMPEGLRTQFSKFAGERYKANELAAMYGRTLDVSREIAVSNNNEPGWQVFLEFLDQRVSGLIRIMADNLSVPLSFEVRVDSDPVLVDGHVAEWYAHDATYDVQTSDVTTMYYAPYWGQANIGERLTSEQAMSGLRKVVKTVGRHTENDLFIDQFNVVFNTPGFEHHAQIVGAELDRFFDKAGPYLALRTLGYGLWAYKDYYTNQFYNPSFELGLSGWQTDGPVQTTAAGVVLQPGAEIHQTVRPSIGLAPHIDICVWGSSSAGGTVTVSTIGGVSKIIDLSRPQARPENCAALPGQAIAYPVTFRAADKPVRLQGVVFNTHMEVSGVYDVDNRPASLRGTIARFNRAVKNDR
jgi:hypothetical protein